MVGEIDSEVVKLIEARGRPAVLKAALINCRSKLPHTIIFAFEGPDDKLAFSQWIARLRPGFVYEPFTCKGKRQVLQLHNSIIKDKAGLADGVYFFVDRDFDDLLGFAPSDRLFMTQEYSIENSVVHLGTLENLLKNEFHCDSAPELREAIVILFAKVYSDFLSATQALNNRLFLAKQLGLDMRKSNKIKDIARVELESVAQSDTPFTEAIELPREPTDAEVVAQAVAFAALAPATRYRGKWAFQFFLKWLECLHAARKAGSDLFKGTDLSQSVNISAITIQTLASKSGLPAGFEDFLATVPDGI
ncbi:DUF4435 domain-containing protein [Paradevosia shaoguanensis]|uniref:DUF4435 domain-containing protein n=1 Tax=Paradevosia shaoguanensis TaxID=1335043 RepID=UPI0019334F11|nr:DUF4435 domain-containing protein [Paradevosia shaoguanensis]